MGHTGRQRQKRKLFSELGFSLGPDETRFPLQKLGSPQAQLIIISLSVIDTIIVTVNKVHCTVNMEAGQLAF